MKNVVLLWGFMLVLAVSVTDAQDLSGQWQGTLHARDLKYVLRISKAKDGNWSAVFYSVGRTPDGVPVEAITLRDSTLDFTVTQVNGKFEGTLNQDGTAVSGTWTQGTASPLELTRATTKTAWPTDISPHKRRLISVEKGVTLEVLDWGGSGSALVFLAGGGDTAHVFDSFAPKFTDHHHVYGITRRGWGNSSHPAPVDANFSVERLGDDVLAVIDALKLEKPLLAGHSLAGEELSSICTRQPEKVSGLIYMEAASGYAFYSGQRGAAALNLDANELRRELDGQSGLSLKANVQEMLEVGLPNVQKDLEDLQKNLQALPDTPHSQTPTPAPATYEDRVFKAIDRGQQKFKKLNCPMLAMFAWPPGVTHTMIAQAKAIESAIPSAHVVRLASPNAGHYIYRTNEREVEQEMNAFMDGLPKKH